MIRTRRLDAIAARRSRFIEPNKIRRKRAGFAVTCLIIWMSASIANLFAASAHRITESEKAQVRAWIEAKLGGIAHAPSPQPYLVASFKSGRLLKNRATTKVYHIDVGALPLRIADKSYERGLYCPSVGKVDVHLGAAGRKFEAIVGVDSSRATSFYSNAG